MSYYIDIHSHSTISNANLCIHNLNNFERIPNLNPKFSFSAGIHPWFIGDNWEMHLNQIEKLLSDNKIIAIGECGIDKNSNTDLALQKKIFIEQAILAEKFKKPMIIHCVKSYYELFETIKINKISQTLIFHGYKNKPSIAESIINEGFYLSFGSTLLKNNLNSLGTLNKIPKNNFFFETDDSGTSIADVYMAASQILKLSIDELSEQIKLNYNRLFYG